MQLKKQQYYDEDYFDWQSPMGELGGWANLKNFSKFVNKEDVVLDFGCGGGYLLKSLKCKKKIGIEINETAAKVAEKNGVKVYPQSDLIPDETIDVIISDNALEHTLRPFDELTDLYKKLKPGGKIIFVVPCESIRFRYVKTDINKHLYSWSPMCIGNLFTQAGFNVIESKPLFQKWPPKHQIIAKIGGRKVFDLLSKIYGRIARKWIQIQIIAKKNV